MVLPAFLSPGVLRWVMLPPITSRHDSEWLVLAFSRWSRGVAGYDYCWLSPPVWRPAGDWDAMFGLPLRTETNSDETKRKEVSLFSLL
jgi:hypothetical protein